MDTRSPAQRRKIMQAVGQRNTGPELALRSALHKLGYRFRLHCKELPGRPDLVFPGRKKAIFVHGCFWHRHNCPKGRLPKSGLTYWQPKLEKNVARDERNVNDLQRIGWRCLVVWQCEIKDLPSLLGKVSKFLGAPRQRVAGIV